MQHGARGVDRNRSAVWDRRPSILAPDVRESGWDSICLVWGGIPIKHPRVY